MIGVSQTRATGNARADTTETNTIHMTSRVSHGASRNEKWEPPLNRTIPILAG